MGQHTCAAWQLTQAQTPGVFLFQFVEICHFRFIKNQIQFFDLLHLLFRVARGLGEDEGGVGGSSGKGRAAINCNHKTHA